MSYELRTPLLAESDALRTIARRASRPLRRGSAGNPVQRVQLALRLTEPALCPLPLSFGRQAIGEPPRLPDGDYGDETWRAVKAFQAKHFPLHADWHTGLTGPETLHRLDELLSVQGTRAGAIGAAALAAAPPAPPPALVTRSTDALLVQLIEAVRRRSAALSPQDTDYLYQAPLHVVLLPATIRMKVVQREDSRRLTDTLAFVLGNLPGWKAAVNGSFGSCSAADEPVPTHEYGIYGEVASFVDGYGVFRHRAPRSTKYGTHHASPSGAYLAYAPADRGRPLLMGPGALPEHVAEGLSGLTPVILATEPREIDGPENPEYRGVAYVPYLPLPRVCGRSLVGRIAPSGRIVLIVQQDAGSRYELDELRLFAHDIGCHRVVGLDGSDSVLLWVANHRPHPAVVSNARRKNNVCATAIAFYE